MLQHIGFKYGNGWWIYPYGNKEVAKKIIRIGQVSIVNSQAGIVYHRKGKMVTLIAGTHGYAMGYVLRKCRIK